MRELPVARGSERETTMTVTAIATSTTAITTRAMMRIHVWLRARGADSVVERGGGGGGGPDTTALDTTAPPLRCPDLGRRLYCWSVTYFAQISS